MFNECEKACIYTLDGDYIAEVKVMDSDKDSMGLLFEEQDIEKVKTETVIVFYDGIQGLVTCKCRLSARVKLSGREKGVTGRAVYKVPCKIDELLGVEQRRRDLKVRVSFPILLETSDADGKITHIAAKVRDVSAGGIGLESAQKMEAQQSFSFLFDTDAGCTRLKATVLWGKKLSYEDEPPYYRYGCRFIDLTVYQESMVRKFTFQEQLRKRKMV